MLIYIIGQITGNPDYREQFARDCTRPFWPHKRSLMTTTEITAAAIVRRVAGEAKP
mgnify:CR=1 FL=1